MRQMAGAVENSFIDSQFIAEKSIFNLCLDKFKLTKNEQQQKEASKMFRRNQAELQGTTDDDKQSK